MRAGTHIADSRTKHGKLAEADRIGTVANDETLQETIERLQDRLDPAPAAAPVEGVRARRPQGEQLKASIVAIAIAIGVVAVSWQRLFAEGKLPPSSQVFADTIMAGVSDPRIAPTMALWAIPGALVQLLGGSKRQMGVLFATGLLVATPNAGWLVLVGAGIIAADSIMSAGKVIRF
ncbi:hypothetical protein [Leucobacter sp.]